MSSVVNLKKANVKQAVPFFRVENMERSVRFYVEGLGFAMKHQWLPEGKLEWCWLDLDGVSLMLQEYRPGRRPEGKLGVGMTVCFQCDDSVGFYREGRARGVEAAEPVVGNGVWGT